MPPPPLSAARAAFVPAPPTRPSSLISRPFCAGHHLPPHSPVRMSSSSSPAAPSGAAPPRFKLALCQMPVTDDKPHNLRTARDYLHRAAAAGAQLAVLPECFNAPYDTRRFAAYAEPLPSPSSSSPAPATLEDERTRAPSLDMLRTAARETGLYVVGGSMPEVDAAGRLYNTSVALAPDGLLLAKHRKVHLFDIDVPGRITFRESDALAAGAAVTTFRAAGLGVSVGLGICYDVRFPDFVRATAAGRGTMTDGGDDEDDGGEGATLLVFPAAFNMTTGPAHWDVLLRARALDSQVYVAACAPARWADGGHDDDARAPPEKGHYVPWAHSTVVDPWAERVAVADEAACIITAEYDGARVSFARQSIPVRRQRRDDVYARALTGDGSGVPAASE